MKRWWAGWQADTKASGTVEEWKEGEGGREEGGNEKDSRLFTHPRG